MKEFILRDDLQPQMAAGQRPFSNAQDHFVQYQMHDHGGEQDNAEDNHQRAGGVISIPKAAICDINSCITSPEYPAGMMTAG